MKLVILSILTCALMACGDNIRAAEDDLDETCLDEDCPVDVDMPDGGVPMPDADTGGGADGGTGGDDAGTDGGGGVDGGTGGGTDGGTDGGGCGTCPDGQVCVDGACVCDGEPEDAGCAPEEVRLCHAPPGHPDGAHAICVGASAAEAHLAHGDTLGDCP